MISDAASRIVEILIRNRIIHIQQAPAYQYGFEIFISSLLTCLITVISGIIFHCLFAALIYFGLFVVLRSVCGGYHAQTYLKCNLIFTFVTILVLSLYKFMPPDQFTEFHYCSILLSILITAFYLPVENDNKSLSTNKKRFFRILGMTMVALLSLISCLLKIKIRSSYSILIDTTLLVVAVSMFVTDPRRGDKS